MVQKLRKRFIIVAMLSTLIVLLSIIGGMNIINFHKLISQADTMTRMICENDGKFPQSKNEPAHRSQMSPSDKNSEIFQKQDSPPDKNISSKNNDSVNAAPPKAPDRQMDA